MRGEPHRQLLGADCSPLRHTRVGWTLQFCIQVILRKILISSKNNNLLFSGGAKDGGTLGGISWCHPFSAQK